MIKQLSCYFIFILLLNAVPPSYGEDAPSADAVDKEAAGPEGENKEEVEKKKDPLQEKREREAAFMALSTKIYNKNLQVYKAGDSVPVQPAPPPAEELSYRGVKDAACAALICASEFLFSRVGSNDLKLVVQPAKYVAGYTEAKEVEVRYSWKEVDEDVFDEKWENYETFEQRGGDSAADPAKRVRVTKRRLVSREKTGTRKVRRLEHDPNGSEVRTHRVNSGPIYGHRLQKGVLGLNAMAMLALYEAGVPESDPRMKDLKSHLGMLVSQFGPPDMTWDLAWLSAAFACDNSGRYDEKVFLPCLNKLLDGQITYGKARGMWGPVCINMELLAAAMKIEQELGGRLAEAKEKLGKNPNSRLRKEGVDDAETLLSVFANTFERISLHGNRYNSMVADYKFGQQFNVDGLDVMTIGLPYFIYDQSLADMEYTALAVYAINKVFEKRGQLPAETVHPENPVAETAKQTALMKAANKEQPSVPLLPPEKTSAILARAASAIAGLQQKTGAWSESMIYEYGVTPLAGGAVGVKFENPVTAVDVKSAITPLSISEGFASLERIGNIVGMKRFLAKFPSNLGSGYKALMAAVEKYLQDTEPMVVPDKGTVLPAKTWFYLSSALRAPTTRSEIRRDIWSRLAFQAVSQQEEDGSWGGGVAYIYSKLEWEGLQAWLKVNHELSNRIRPAGQKVDYLFNRYSQYAGDYVDARIPATCYAMLFLADGVRPPPAGFLAKTPFDNPTVLLDKTIEFYEKKRNSEQVPLRLAAVSGESLSSLDLCPALIGTPDLFADPGMSRDFGNAVARGAVLIVEIPAEANPSDAEAKIISLVPGGKVAKIPQDAPFLKQYEGGNPPELKGIIGPQGDVAAVFIPWAQQEGGGRLSPAKAANVIIAMLKHLGNAAGMRLRTYPFQINGSGTPFETRILLLDAMKKGVAPVSLPDAGEAAGQEGGGADIEAPKSNEPAADEVW